MKRKITYAVLLFIGILLVFGFMNWDINPGHWRGATRVIAIIAAVTFSTAPWWNNEKSED